MGSSDVPTLTPDLASSSTSSAAMAVTQSADLNYQCGECLGTYKDDIDLGNGAEWVQCGCGQWIHEECIDVVVTDEDGNERICSSCVV